MQVNIGGISMLKTTFPLKNTTYQFNSVTYIHMLKNFHEMKWLRIPDMS